MNPSEELYPGSDFEADMTDQDQPKTEIPTDQTSEDTFGEQIVPDEGQMEDVSAPDADRIETNTPLNQLQDEQTY